MILIFHFLKNFNVVAYNVTGGSHSFRTILNCVCGIRVCIEQANELTRREENGAAVDNLPLRSVTAKKVD